jgi:hypothetical protein
MDDLYHSNRLEITSNDSHPSLKAIMQDFSPTIPTTWTNFLASIFHKKSETKFQQKIFCDIFLSQQLQHN